MAQVLIDLEQIYRDAPLLLVAGRSKRSRTFHLPDPERQGREPLCGWFRNADAAVTRPREWGGDPSAWGDLCQPCFLSYKHGVKEGKSYKAGGGCVGEMPTINLRKRLYDELVRRNVEVTEFVNRVVEQELENTEEK